MKHARYTNIHIKVIRYNVSVRACVRVCGCAGVRIGMRVFVSVFVCICASACVCLCMFTCVLIGMCIINIFRWRGLQIIQIK